MSPVYGQEEVATEYTRKRCFRCTNGLMMPDGNAWCQLTMRPEDGCDAMFSPGMVKIYVPEKMEIAKKIIRRKKPGSR